jgi:DNA-binding XRE family transcriptional regulator
MNTKKQLSLGQFLKAHRQGEELSQVEFAKLLGVSRQRMCDLEANRSNVSIKFCKELAAKLNLPPEWIVKIALQHQLDQAGVNLKIS